MKNAYTKFLWVLLISLIFSSCNKNKKNIVGTWRATTLLVENCNNSSENLFLLLSGYKCNEVNTDFCMELIFIFEEDGNFTQTLKSKRGGISDNNDLSGTYLLDDNNIKVCINNFCNDIIYEEDTITFNFEEDDTGCVITYVFHKI